MKVRFGFALRTTPGSAGGTHRDVPAVGGAENGTTRSVDGGCPREGRLYRYEGTERSLKTDRSRGVGDTVTHKTQTVRRTRRRRREDGAALVEFAVLAPLLILLLFGIIEFAWLFSQNLDARHGAREGARIAAVDEFVDTDSSGSISAAEAAQQVCIRMDTAAVSGDTRISTTRTGTTVGSDITVTVDAPPQSLTGLFTNFIPSTLRLVATTTIRLEQPSPIWPVFANELCP